MSLSRRHLLQTASAFTAIGFIGCSDGAVDTVKPVDKTAEVDAATSVLDAAKDFMLRSYPETASSMGIDKGEYAELRAKLSDRSPAGQAAIAKRTRELSKDFAALDMEALSPDLALDVEVVAAVFDRSVKGFDFPMGILRCLILICLIAPAPMSSRKTREPLLRSRASSARLTQLSLWARQKIILRA